jgi:putative membrane protein
MSSLLRFNFVACLGLCCLVASASGQQSLIRRGESDPNRAHEPGAIQSTTRTDLNVRSLQNVDTHFAACLLEANLAEVKLAKIAASRATSEKVKEFAQQAITDHTAIVEKLAKLVGNPEPMDRRSKIEEQINERCLAMLQAELESKSGMEFDTCYLASQVAAHMRLLAALDVLANQTSGQLQQIAKGAQPTVQRHYDEALQLMKQFDGRQASSN